MSCLTTPGLSKDIRRHSENSEVESNDKFEGK